MKRTFSTTFFRRALFLVLLFGGVTNLWGEDKSLPNDGTLSFAWSSRSANHLLGSWDWRDNCISDGLWEWSEEGENRIKMSKSIYCTFKGAGTYNAQTRDRYEFDAGTYTFTFYYYFDESDCQYYEPEVRLSADQDHSNLVSLKGSYVNGHSTGAYTKVVEVEVLSKGYYYIRLITGLNNDKHERFGYEKVVIAKAGPTPPPTPTEKLVYLDLSGFTDWEKDNAHFCIWDGSNNYEMSKMESCNNDNTHLYSVDVPNMASSKTLYIKRADSNCSKWNEVSVSTSISDTKNKMKITDWNAGTWETFTPPTYAVTYAPGDHGTGTMTDSNSPYACGSDVTVLENEFEAARGYAFNNFSDGSKTYDAGDVIEDLQAAKTLTAQWTALTSYTITASASPSHKGHVTGADTYYEGETITLTAVSEDDSKYMFTSWSDGNTSNPRVFTAQSGITTDYVANFISGKKECTNTLTIQCETDYVLPEGKSINNDWFFVPAEGGEHSEYTGSHPTDTKGYVDFKGQGGTMYYPMQIGETATISYDVWICNTDYPKLYIYSSVATSGSSNITYGGKTYYQIESHDIPQVGKPFGHQVIAGSNTLQPGDYIIALGANGWTVIDQIVLTSSPAAFCTVTPAAKCTISYAMNGHGTQIGDVSIEEGETWTAPTPDPIADGWVFDGWKRPNSTGDETLYKSGSTGFTVSGNETLTAQWSEDLSTAYFMKGTFVDDYQTQYNFVKKTGESTGNIAYLTINNLSAGTDYWFMVYRSSPEGHWGQTGKDGKMTADHNTWTLDGGNNVGMTTTAKGSYTFRINFTEANPQIHIEYPTAYTITFNKGNDSATGSMNNMVNIAENEEVTLTANNYALDCNHFVKWVDQDSHEYEDGAQVTVTKDLTLTAQWAVNRYKAIYDANGVSGYTGDLPATVEYNCGDQVTISQTPKLSKFGYTFIGWNTNPAATEALEDDYQFTIDQGDTKIYAIWSATKPTSISIEPETGGNSPAKGTTVQMIATLTPDPATMAEENRALTWSSTDATKAFIDQKGFVSFVGTGTVTITATSKVAGSVSGNYTFYVQAGNCDGLKIHAYGTGYEEDDYFHPISYGANEWRCPYVLKSGGDHFWVGECNNDAGGWQSDHSEIKSFNDIPLRDYREVKTNPAQDLVGTLVIWNNSGDKNYGICFEPTYQVSYMTDASTWRIMEFYPTSTAYAYETEVLQVPEGYKNNANMKYFVGLKKADGTNVSIYNKSSQDAMNSVSGLSSADMAGKFGKWHIISNSGYMNWYCQFTRYYQVRFEMNGGDGNIDPMYFVGDNLQSFNTSTLTNPTRTGYELTGWKDQEDHTYTTSQNITVTKDLVLTAQWTAKDYTITLDNNNGSTDGSASAKYDSNTLNSISHVGARTGYTLTGYFTLAENGSQVITAEGALVASAPDYTDENRNWKKASDCTLYAQWTAKKYTVNFDFDGGTGGMTSIEVTYDAAMPAVDPLPTREFYDFAGYYTEKNGQGTQYYTASGTSAHVWDITTDNTTLYAYWTPKSYAITWNFDGGHATSEDYTKGDVPYGTTIKAPTVEKTGYNFAGWNPAVGTMPGAATTYTAQWTAKQHKVTINLDGGTIEDDTWTLEDDSYYKMFNFGAIISLPTPSKAGYTFNAWTPAVPETMPDEDVALTATWKVDYCSNTLRIDCPVDWVKHVDCRANNESKFGTFYSSTEGGWITHHDGDGVGDMYFVYNTSAESEITFNIHVGGLWNDGQAVAYFYNEDENGSLEINDVKYSQDGSSQNIWRGSEHQTLEYITIVRTISAGKHILHFHASNYVNFDVVDLSASSSVFCPEMYTITFPQPEHGTVTAQTVGGDAINSGDEVPEGTDVIFTWNKESGYDFVKFSVGTTDYTINPCTLTVNSDLTVTTTVEVEATKHTLTVNAGDHGSVSPEGETEVGEGREVTITATPDSHYGFASWTATGITLTSEQEKQNPLKITMPTNDVTLTASFEYVYVDNIIVTGTAYNEFNDFDYGQGGSGDLNGTSIADPNTFFNPIQNVLKITYSGMNNGNDYMGQSIRKDEGYSSALSNNATGFGFYYMTPSTIQSIAVVFQFDSQHILQLNGTNGLWKYYYIATSEANNFNGEVRIYINGEKDGNKTQPASGTLYIANICATEYTTKPEETPVYTATFAANPSNKATVTATVDDAAIASGATVDAGKSITFDYSEVAANYRFDGWTATGITLTDAQKQENPLIITMPSASITLTANFVRVYTLTINNDGHGSATVSPQKDAYAEGESITVTSQPTAGYKFTAWLNGSNEQESTDDPYTFTMPASDKTLKVTFEESINYYDINTAVSGEGTVTIKVDGETHTGQHILEGTQVTLTATPNSESYAFTQWQDGNTDNPRTITANATNAGTTWTATFTQAYTVSVELGAPGKEVIGVGKYGGDAQVTLNAVAATEDSQGKAYDLEYQLKEWTAQGVDISGHEHDNPLTFKMPYTNVTLTATFAPVECVNTKTIQCETDGTYIKFIEQGDDLSKYPSEIPHSENCGPFSDYYKGWHGTGYYDFKEATNTEMYYPVELPASTYKFEVWSASNGDKDCYMNLYVESNEDPDIIYKGVSYKKTSYVTANNNCGAGGNFRLSGTIDKVALSSPKSVIVGLHCNQDFGSFDQIVITADDDVFCAPLSTTDFVIKADEIKEIPVCGVDNLTIYDGGQANNNDDVEVFKQVKYSRTVNDLDKWETFAVPYNANEITVQDLPNNDLTEYTINPIYGEEGKYNAGYFYMEELKGEDATLVGRPFATRWEISENQYPQQNVPYIIRFPHEQSNGYFANTQINYKYKSTGLGAGGASVTLTGKKNATIIEEDYPGLEEKPTFYFYANNTLANIQLETSAYILNEDGMNFDIQDQPIIPPFHCYVQATQEIKQLYPRIAIRKKDDGGITTELIPISVEEMNAAHVEKFIKDDIIYILRDNKIYTIMGQPVK